MTLEFLELSFRLEMIFKILCFKLNSYVLIFTRSIKELFQHACQSNSRSVSIFYLTESKIKIFVSIIQNFNFGLCN